MKKISLLSALTFLFLLFMPGTSVSADDGFVECIGAKYIGCETGVVSTQQEFPIFIIELTFSEPVTVKDAGSIWLRYSAENGKNQIKPKDGIAGVTYIDPEIVDGESYSSTIRLRYDGYTSAKTGDVDSEFYLNGYCIVFSEYNNKGTDDGISTEVIHGKNGKPLKHTYTSGEGFDFAVVDFSADIGKHTSDKKCVLKKAIRASDRIFVLEFNEPIKIFEGNTPFFGIRLVDDGGNVVKSGDTYLQYFSGTWEYYDDDTKNVILWIADDGDAVSDILNKEGDYSAPEFSKYHSRFCIEEKPACGYDTHDGTITGVFGTESMSLLKATNISDGKGYDRILRITVTDYGYTLPERYAENSETITTDNDNDQYGNGIIFTTGDSSETNGTDYTLPLIVIISVIVIAGITICIVIIRKKSGEEKA